jgi:hypothetical protein
LQDIQYLLILRQALRNTIKKHCFVNVQGDFDTIDIVGPDNRIVNGAKWVSFLQEQDSSIIKLQLRYKQQNHAVLAANIATHTPVDSSEGAKAIKLKANTGVSNHSNRDSKARTIEYRDTTESRLSDSSLESNPYSTECRSVVLSRTQPPSQLQPDAPRPSIGAIVPYSPVDPALGKSHDSTPYILPNLPAPVKMEKILEEKGVLLFDKAILQEYPEIYAPSSTAIVRFHLPVVDDSTALEYPTIPRGLDPQNNENYRADDLGQNRSVDSTPGDKPKQPLSITIPPFFSWATTQESVLHDTSQESSIDTIVKVMESIHQGLQQTVRHSNQRRTYRKSKRMVRAELEAQFPSLRAVTHDQMPREDYRFDTKHTLLKNTTLQNDSVHDDLLQACDTRLKSLYTVLNSFLSLYFPLASPSISDHSLVQKCWGAFGLLMTVSERSLLQEVC